jgi:hypothetical protein
MRTQKIAQTRSIPLRRFEMNVVPALLKHLDRNRKRFQLHFLRDAAKLPVAFPDNQQRGNAMFR